MSLGSRSGAGTAFIIFFYSTPELPADLVSSGDVARGIVGILGDLSLYGCDHCQHLCPLTLTMDSYIDLALQTVVSATFRPLEVSSGSYPARSTSTTAWHLASMMTWMKNCGKK